MPALLYDTQYGRCISAQIGYELTGEAPTMAAQTQTARGKPSTDRIEKRYLLRAPRSRVWRAIATVQEFNTWFRVNLEGVFAEGATVRGKMTIPGLEHVTMEFLVERIEPERYFSYRWQPYPMDPAVDYSAEPTTLVEFTLEETKGGTVLTIVESGFDGIPLARRAEAFRKHEEGWDEQIGSLERYVT
jgi:uncharacterized protein YndB with AHSA1/START domain